MQDTEDPEDGQSSVREFIDEVILLHAGRGISLTVAEIENAITKLETSPCELCGNFEIAGHTLFIPHGNEVESYGGRKGQTRVFFYNMCETCLDLGEHGAVQVEEKIKSRYLRIH